MITSSSPEANEYATWFAGYVRCIGDYEDIVAGHTRHHLEVLESRYSA